MPDPKRIFEDYLQNLAEEPRIYINAQQYFEPVPREIWEYRVGSYQVCEKWLKDFQEQQLKLDDVKTFCHIVTALKETLQLQRGIDQLYALVETNPLSMEMEDAKDR